MSVVVASPIVKGRTNLSHSAKSPRPQTDRPVARPNTNRVVGQSTKKPIEPGEQPILFQKFFKSVGPRTYAAQVKRANNGNQFLVMTEGKRDKGSDEVRKTKLFVFSEDFDAFLSMVNEVGNWLKAHPLPPDVRKRRQRYWAKNDATPGTTPATGV
jgi:hypothetical protein